MDSSIAMHHAAAAERAASRYASIGQRGYARGKLRLDPSFAAVAEILAGTRLPLLDIGCGMGLLGFYLRERGFSHDHFGIDNDPRKITAGRKIAEDRYRRVRLDVSDARELPRFCGNVVILDVLHYLPRDAQQALLLQAAERVAVDGKLIIRNCLRDDTLRYRLTVWAERLLHGVGWMRTQATHFPERSEVERPLATAGLCVDTRPLWGFTPYNSYLIVAQRH